MFQLPVGLHQATGTRHPAPLLELADHAFDYPEVISIQVGFYGLAVVSLIRPLREFAIGLLFLPIFQDVFPFAAAACLFVCEGSDEIKSVVSTRRFR